MKTEILFGVHPVREALYAGKRAFFTLYVSKSRKEAAKGEFMSLAEERGIPIEEPDDSFFRGQDRGHQGVAARVSVYQTISLQEILSKAKGQAPFILLLDGITDPQNCGALIRSALCAGVHGVAMPANRSVPLTPAVSKASAGALEHMPVARVVNLVRSMEFLKDQGVWITGMDASGGISIWDARLDGAAAVVVGSEGKGLRALVKKACDQLVNIPQTGPLGSLNASVAGALAMYEVVRQRRD